MRIARALLAAVGTTLAAQNHIIVPAEAGAADASSVRWIAGFTTGLRQQILIDPHHLTAVAGKRIVALTFRRDAGYARALQGGTVDLTVELGHCPTPAAAPSPIMAQNLGAPPTAECFQGTIVLPSSPAVTGASVPWDAQNSVTIPLSTPFVYTGGTLCIDLLGRPNGPTASPIWPGDAALDSVRGTVQQLGRTCQPTLATPAGGTSRVGPDELVPGSTATFIARGTPHATAILLVGHARRAPLNLAFLGLPSCDLQLDPVASVTTTFGAPPLAFATTVGGEATASIDLPGSTALFGASFAAQWIDAGPPLALTNAVRCGIATALPTLGMATVTAFWDGGGVPATGWVDLGVGHVLRIAFE
jgi:hypothetical protein